MSEKIYTSKTGLKFGISRFPKPATEDHVYFQSEEMTWLQQQNLKDDEFRFLWNAKKNDFTYCIIADADNATGKALADKYCPEIVDIIKGKKKPE